MYTVQQLQILTTISLLISSVDATRKSGRRLVGDVDFHEAKKVASWITPVPGGRAASLSEAKCPGKCPWNNSVSIKTEKFQHSYPGQFCTLLFVHWI